MELQAASIGRNTAPESRLLVLNYREPHMAELDGDATCCLLYIVECAVPDTETGRQQYCNV